MLTCKKCGKNLIQEDIIDKSGGIDEGYVLEQQLWSCECCEIDYIVYARADLKNIDYSDFQEA